MDKTILAARLERADERVKSAATALAGRFGVSETLVNALNKSPKTSDPEVKRMAALENVAAILEAMLGSAPHSGPIDATETSIEQSASTDVPPQRRGRKDS